MTAALLTYLLHGAAWAAGAALAARSRAFSASVQSYVWLAALLCPMLTSGFAITASASRPYVRALEVRLQDSAPLESGLPRLLERDAPDLSSVLLVAAALGSLRFGLALFALRRRLRARAPVTDPRVLHRLEQLRRRSMLARVRLTHSVGIDVPLVLGRSEICLPTDSLSEASDREIDAVLAHELAHLGRRDGFVFPLVGFVQAIGWLHPLHHFIASQFRQAAELACDDRAVELTGDRSALAHALANVAQAALGATRDPMLPAIARPRATSSLVVRVRRLVGVPDRAPRVRAHWAAVSCVVLAIVTSSVSVRAARRRVVAQREAVTSTSASATEQIAALMDDAQRLEREIASLQLAGRGESEPRLLELQQQLRHIRETAAWIERESSGQARP